MRNLKKVLSLVLCVAVMLSVMVLGAGAAFSDQDQIENTEAVDACSALNIIGGYEDGSFHPERNIKRSEITKMICVALNGGQEPNVGTNEVPTFTDVRGTSAEWAEGYIESCVAQGIVSGVGGGRFSPDGNVTASQLAKMLLVALGYNSDNEGFTGNAWETNVNVRAAQKGLYAGLSNMDTSAAVTRDQAAQMVWNAMQAYEVEYKTNIITDENGNLVTQITVQDKVVGNNNDKITLLRDKYDAWVNVGTLTTVNSNTITITMSASDIAASDLEPASGSTTISFSKLTTDYSSLLGQKVKVMFKDGKTNDVLGVYAVSDNTVYTTYLNQTELDGDKIKFDSKSYSVDDADTNTTGVQINVITDGGTATAKNIDTFADTAANKVSMNKVTFVDTDDNNKIDVAIITTYVGGEVTYVGSDKITFDGKSYNFSDENIDKNIVKDDFAVMSENLYGDCKDIVRADVVTAELTAYKEKTGYFQYEIDGVWYNADAKFDVNTGDTVKAYVFNGVALDISADDSDGAIPSDIAVVVGVGDSTLNGDQAKIRFFDGTSKTVTMSDDSVAVTIGTAYKVSSSDSDMKFENLTLNNKYNGYEYVSAKADAQGGTVDEIDDTKIADDAVIILYTTTGRSKQINGKQFKALADDAFTTTDAATAVFIKETDGLTRVKMAAVKVQSTDLVGESSDNYAYIVTAGVKASDGVRYTIWTGSENVTVVEDTSYSANTRAKGTLIGYSEIDENGFINDVKVYGTIDDAKDATGTLKTTEMYRGGNEASVSSYIAIGGAQFNVTADTTVLLVDSKADNDSEIGLNYTYGDKLPQGSKYKDGTTDKYLVNAFWIMDEEGSDDADIAVLVIDSTGAFDGFELDDVNAPKITAAEKSGNAESMKFGDSEVTLTYTATSVNFASDAAKQTLTATVSGGNDNTTDITNGTVDFEVKNNGTQDVTVKFGPTAKIDTYTITIKAGNTVLLTDTFNILPKDANTSSVPTFTGTVTGGTTKVKEIDASMFTPGDASYTITSVKITVDDVEMTSGSDLLYVIQSGSTVTADVTVTAAENYAFPNGASTHVFEDVEVTVS